MTNLTTEAQAMCERLERTYPPSDSEVCVTADGLFRANPDGPDAAALIQKLLAERETLREALNMARVAASSFRLRLEPHELEQVRSALSDGGER